MDDLIKRFYEGKTSPEEEKILFSTKHEDPVTQKIMQDQQEYFEAFKINDPGQLWSAHKGKFIEKRPHWHMPLRVAASLLIGAALFAGGYFSYLVVHDPSEEISKLQMELMQSRLTLIEETISQGSSYSTRKGLAMVSTMNYMNNRIADELLTILNSSDNINLRLMALEQLGRHIGTPSVREKIFGSIKFQDSELVLGELARMAIIIKDKVAARRILDAMENLSTEKGEVIPFKKELEVFL